MQVIKLIRLSLFSFSIFSTMFLYPLHAQTPVKNMVDMYMAGTFKIEKDGTPLKQADVEYRGQTVSTNNNGIANMEDIMIGPNDITVISNGLQYTQKINVQSPSTTVDLTGTGTPFIKPAAATTTATGSGLISSQTNAIIGISLIIALVLITTIVLYLRNKYKKNNASKESLNKFAQKKYNLALAGIMGVFVSVLLIVQVISIIPVSNYGGSTITSHASTTIPTPANLTAENDDRVARLHWNDQSPYGQYSYESNNNISGYLVKWGKTSLGFVSTTITPYREIDLQPIENGTPYEAQIYALDSFGNLSAPSNTINFTGDSSRVDTLRTQMNGFFDDFNTPSGALDETKWNFSVSDCALEGQAGQFINSQYHAHLQTFDGYCDRGQVISRPRQVFDFTNRTGTITMDLDSVARRDKWYLDFSPVQDINEAPRDISGHIGLDTVKQDGGVPSDPPGTLRIEQEDSGLAVFQFGSDGYEYNVTPTTACTDLRFCTNQSGQQVNLTSIHNVRRHWKVTVSQSHMQIIIDNAVVWDGNLNLTFTKAYLFNTLFSYNTPKSNEESVLMHWDNFGFDAPSGFTPKVVHNYVPDIVGTPGNNGNGPEPLSTTDSTTPYKYDIKVPDSISGATSARLMFTLQEVQNQCYGYNNTSQTILFNGTSLPLPAFKDPLNLLPQCSQGLVTAYNPYSMSVNIPLTSITQGDNNIELRLANTGILNTHLEINFPSGSTAPYTQPSQIYSDYVNKLIPSVAEMGPNVVIYSIGSISDVYDTIHGISPDNNARMTTSLGTISGLAPMSLYGGTDLEMAANGISKGISYYQLLVDRKVITEKRVDTQTAVPTFSDTYNLDTTQLCNGNHEIFLRAYNPDGVTSLMDYFEADTQIGAYYYFTVTTNNPGAPACSGSYIPLDTPNPYPSGTPLLTTDAINSMSTTPVTTTITTPTTSSIVTTSPAPTTIASTSTILPVTTTSSGCVCQSNNLCSNSCVFNKLTISGVTYQTQFSCTKELVIKPTPSLSDQNNFCNRPNRAKGDADGNGIVDNTDYFYYVRAVNGGQIPSGVFPDFDGNGLVSPSDRLIIIQGLKTP